MRRLLLLIIVAGTLIVAGRPALGCSCAYGDPRSALAISDGAFIGRLESKQAPTPEPSGTYSSAEPVTYTFLVERSIKGNLGKEVDVVAAAGGSSCGLAVTKGERTGLFLHRDGDQWKSGLCSQIDPDALIEAATPMPAPTSKGPVTFVLGGRYGPATTLALDRKGKTVAYGLGSEWDTTNASVCPGSRVVVEWGRELGGSNVPIMAVRRFDRFGVAKAQRIPALRDSEPNFNRLVAISCRDENGTEVFVAVSDHGAGGDDSLAQGRILRLGGNKIKTLYSGTLQTATFSKLRERAYITGGISGEDAMVVDLSTGRSRFIAKIPRRSEGLALSPGETRLATRMVPDPANPTSLRISVVDMTRSPARVRSVLLKEEGAYGDAVWADDETVVFVPGGGDSDRVQVFDHRLLRQGSFSGWHSIGAVIVEGTMYGTGWGKLLSASLPNGPVRTLRTFETPVTYTLAFVPAAAKPQAEKPKPSTSPSAPTPVAEPTFEPSHEPRALGSSEPSALTRTLLKTAAVVITFVVAASWLLIRRRKGSAFKA